MDLRAANLCARTYGCVCEDSSDISGLHAGYVHVCGLSKHGGDGRFLIACKGHESNNRLAMRDGDTEEGAGEGQQNSEGQGPDASKRVPVAE